MVHPGDVIKYNHALGVTGSKDLLRTETIIKVTNNKTNKALTLSNGDYLLDDINVKK